MAADEVLRPNRSAEHLSEQPQGAVAGFVAVGVVENFEVVQVRHCQGEDGILRSDRCHLLLEGASVEESGQVVGSGLQLCFGHDPEQAEACAGELGEGFGAGHGVVGDRCVGFPGGVDDADGAAHDRHWHAQS